MSIDEIGKDAKEILERARFMSSLTMQLLGQIEFQGYMLRHLYQERLLRCDDPLGEMKRIEKESMDDIRFMEITANDDPNACMLIQEGAIEAGERFFAAFEKSINEQLKIQR